MSEEDLKAELDRLRKGKRIAQKGYCNRHQNEGERKGCCVHLRHGSLSRNFDKEQWRSCWICRPKFGTSLRTPLL